MQEIRRPGEEYGREEVDSEKLTKESPRSLRESPKFSRKPAKEKLGGSETGRKNEPSGEDSPHESREEPELERGESKSEEPQRSGLDVRPQYEERERYQNVSAGGYKDLERDDSGMSERGRATARDEDRPNFAQSFAVSCAL
jgi:hypothetical protein